MRGRKLLAAGFVLVLTAIMALALGWLGVWRAIDHLVFRMVYLPDPPRPAAGLRLIDVPYPSESESDEDLLRFRQALGAVMRQLAELPAPPRTVVLDIFFSSNQVGQDVILAGIAALQQRGVCVLAAVTPLGEEQAEVTSAFMSRHNRAIYLQALDGYGHTLLSHSSGLLWYDTEIEIKASVGKGASKEVAGSVFLPALPVIATMDPAFAREMPPSLIIPLGDDAAFASKLHRYRLEASSLDPALPMSPPATHVLIGSLERDTGNKLGRPGTLLLAWAMSDLLAGKASRARAPLNDWGAIVGLCAVTGLFVAGAFWIAYQLGLSRTLPRQWRQVPWFAATGSFLFGSGFVLLAAALLHHAGRVSPFALPVVSALTISGITLFYAVWDVEQRLFGYRATAKIRKEFDVFVSYSRKDSKWVDDNIVAPLRHRSFRVFLDRSDIEGGAPWDTSLQSALLASRFVIAVYSESYYRSGWCLAEHRAAVRKHNNGETQLLPIYRTRDAVPDEHKHEFVFAEGLQAFDPALDPAFIERIAGKIRHAGSGAVRTTDA